ncbi:Na+/H+ antiporter subunit A [Corynebacterium tapiri]|uniref:Na+/H+ antiporter subunit A n=1 Tax=Corynebacterium tapiri TaxID=1448266 RepID=A0A5C4U364_9CORY|nr:Na+/H+ antiporter subunit A [Corynebacterium tapiri]TNL96116.1 Na+/H+ antiporter subunit A [Corynebacterium tapiri]
MIFLLFALCGATILAAPLIRVMGRAAFALLALVPAAGFVWLLLQFSAGTFADGGALSTSVEWMPSAHLNLDFRLDSLSGLFGLIILGVGALVLFYCWGYFDSNPMRLAKFGTELIGFAGVMYGLVISNNLLLMYVFWEITSVLSFMLVGYYGERASSRRSAGQALMVTTLGGLAMLVGIILLGTTSGAWTLSDIAAIDTWRDTPYIFPAVVLILAGALSKSAIAPAHFWLPGAMAAPTPVSAYLHSAAMVKAGIYLVARLSPSFNTVAGWHLVVISLGVFTMLLGGWMALKQKDLKLILAYGTVSQLGFIVSVISIGSRDALQAGLALTFAHSLFKAALFMIVGVIDHCTGTRDIRKLSGLGRKQPLLAGLAIVSGLSMAGVPPFLGFIAKESALTTVLHEELLVGMPGNLLLVGLVIGSVLTMAYTLYLLFGALATKDGQTSEAVEKMHSVGPTLWLAPLVLTLTTVLLGLWPAPLDHAVTQHLDAVAPLAEGEKATHLALWHGFTIPLALTAFILAAGAVMYWQRAVVAKAQFEYPALGSADHAYDRVLHFLRVISMKLTASTQRGSLTTNLGVIFIVLILLPVISLLLGERNDVRMILWDTPWQAVVAFVIIVAAVTATTLGNRLSAVVMVGVTGYGMATLFALHGAPDLALTQALVETISVAVFMLILRKLPTTANLKASGDSNRLRAWLAVAVGLSATVVTMFAINARTATPVSVYMPELAENIGHGANAVNVLLVDLRAMDTFGEISVLVIAATGVASLIYRNRSFARPSRRPVLRSEGRRWLAADIEPERALNRSIMVDIATRILFPSMMVLSLYFFFAGHNAPGGGFAGGLVAALAITLRYLAGGRAELEETLPVDAGKMLGVGLIISAAAAIGPMLLGDPPLTSYYYSTELPLIGYFSLPSALVFDAGVYIIVVGLIKHILDSMGGQLDYEEEMRKQRARDRARSLARAAHHRRREALRAGQRMAGPEAPAQGPLPSTPRGKQTVSLDPTEPDDASPHDSTTRTQRRDD